MIYIELEWFCEVVCGACLWEGYRAQWRDVTGRELMLFLCTG